MIAKLMKWRPWPPTLTKKFKVTLNVQSLEGLSAVKDSIPQDVTMMMMMMIEVKWCGPKGPLGYHLRRAQKTARTCEKGLEQGCIINWQQEFQHLCIFTMADEHNGYLPFHVHFTIIQLGTKSKTMVFGTASMNLGHLAPSTQAQNMEHSVKLNVTSPERQQNQAAVLIVTVRFSQDTPVKSLELDYAQHWALSCIGRSFLCDQQILGICGKNAKCMRKMVSFSGRKNSGELEYFVCSGKLITACEKNCVYVKDASDNDSTAGSEGQNEENKRLQSYGSLTGMNLVVEGALPSLIEIREDPSATLGKASKEAVIGKVSTSEPDQSVHVWRLLSWKRRQKLRSPPERGEPLLRKSHSDTGGDDFDLVRHLSLTNDKSQEADRAILSSAAMSECLDCGELQFSVGCWEKKELINRVGHMKLSTKVFFASIDQRSERAGGESACTALVVVIADWLHQNPDLMPIRAEFDMLIRQGSAEWRTLCNEEVYREKFPDQHFDLDTVLEAKIRPLGIVEGGTYVGFFNPEMENSMFDFLHGAVLFDDIWEASIVEESLLLKSRETFEPAVYIVSWNDHFFLLKVDKEAYYIIDTLGERLFEGCKQAYMICFDKETILTHKVEAEQQNLDGRKGSQKAPSSLQTGAKSGISVAVPSNLLILTQPSGSIQQLHQTAQDDGISSQIEEKVSEIEYTGRDACKEFIKGFFAALALKQLHKDIEKGLPSSSPLHKRLQIEFHRTCHNHLLSPLLLQGTSSIMQHS